MNQSRWTVALKLAVTAVGYCFFMEVVAFILAGAGHGWCSGIWSGTAVFVFPLLMVVHVYRDDTLARWIMPVALLGLLAANGFLFYVAWQEGVGYLQRVWDQELGTVIWSVWLALWLGWQILSFDIVFRKGRLIDRFL